MPFLVQLILPVFDPQGNPVPRAQFAQVRRELTDQFGGVTAYTRAPAEGAWEDPEGRIHRDDVVIVEVMTEDVDREWWKRYATELRARFEQEELVVRAIAFESVGSRQ